MSTLVKDWVRNNIFGFKKHDGILHLFFIVLIPFFVSFISLKFFPTDCTTAAYCYLSILISALNSLYDVINRWKVKQKSVVNTKLFIMAIPIFFVISYCIYGLFHTLLTHSTGQPGTNWMLYTYFITIAVAFADIVACFFQDMALKACV